MNETIAKIALYTFVLTFITTIIILFAWLFPNPLGIGNTISEPTQSSTTHARPPFTFDFSTPLPSPTLTPNEPTLQPATPEPVVYLDTDEGFTRLSSLRNRTSGIALTLSRFPRTDICGNTYYDLFTVSPFIFNPTRFTTRLDGNYSRFQAHFFILDGYHRRATILIFLDDEIVFHDSISVYDRRLYIDIDVSNGDLFTIEIPHTANFGGRGIESGLGNAIFIP